MMIYNYKIIYNIENNNKYVITNILNYIYNNKIRVVKCLINRILIT